MARTITKLALTITKQWKRKQNQQELLLLKGPEHNYKLMMLTARNLKSVPSHTHSLGLVIRMKSDVYPSVTASDGRKGERMVS